MSIPQFKLEVVNGKLIRVPIKNIKPKAPLNLIRLKENLILKTYRDS